MYYLCISALCRDPEQKRSFELLWDGDVDKFDDIIRDVFKIAPEAQIQWIQPKLLSKQVLTSNYIDNNGKPNEKQLELVFTLHSQTPSESSTSDKITTQCETKEEPPMKIKPKVAVLGDHELRESFISNMDVTVTPYQNIDFVSVDDTDLKNLEPSFQGCILLFDERAGIPSYARLVFNPKIHKKLLHYSLYGNKYVLNFCDIKVFYYFCEEMVNIDLTNINEPLILQEKEIEKKETIKIIKHKVAVLGHDNILEDFIKMIRQCYGLYENIDFVSIHTSDLKKLESPYQGCLLLIDPSSKTTPSCRNLVLNPKIRKELIHCSFCDINKYMFPQGYLSAFDSFCQDVANIDLNKIDYIGEPVILHSISPQKTKVEDPMLTNPVVMVAECKHDGIIKPEFKVAVFGSSELCEKFIKRFGPRYSSYDFVAISDLENFESTFQGCILLFNKLNQEVPKWWKYRYAIDPKFHKLVFFYFHTPFGKLERFLNGININTISEPSGPTKQLMDGDYVIYTHNQQNFVKKVAFVCKYDEAKSVVLESPVPGKVDMNKFVPSSFCISIPKFPLTEDDLLSACNIYKGSIVAHKTCSRAVVDSVSMDPETSLILYHIYNPKNDSLTKVSLGEFNSIAINCRLCRGKPNPNKVTAWKNSNNICDECHKSAPNKNVNALVKHCIISLFHSYAKKLCTDAEGNVKLVMDREDALRFISVALSPSISYTEVEKTEKVNVFMQRVGAENDVITESQFIGLYIKEMKTGLGESDFRSFQFLNKYCQTTILEEVPLYTRVLTRSNLEGVVLAIDPAETGMLTIGCQVGEGKSIKIEVDFCDVVALYD
jgi:hypothetical protein